MRFIITTLLLTFTLGAFANPKIVVPEIIKNFGEIVPKSKHKHTFIIKNEGTTLLIIKEVKPGCGCTVANISNKKIKAGEQATLKINYNAPAKAGAISKPIYIYSNDKKTPKETLWVKADVKDNFKISAQTIKLGSILIGEKKSFSFTITPIGAIPFSPKKITYGKMFISLKHDQIDPKNPLSGYLFTGTYDAGSKFPPRRISDKIIIYPNKENKQESITIFIHGAVQGQIQQSLKRFLSTIKQGDGSQKKVKLTHVKKEPFKIKEVTSSNPMISAETIMISEHEYDILIKLKEGATKRKESATLLIHTDNPLQKIIRIRCTYLFKPN